MKHIFPVLFCLLLAPSAFGFIAPDERLPDPALEERAIQLGNEIYCPTCAGQPINGSSAETAVAMRSAVRQKLQQEWTDQEIRDWLVSRYGQDVLSRPGRHHAILWLFPLALLGLGGMFIWRFFKTINHDPHLD